MSQISKAHKIQEQQIQKHITHYGSQEYVTDILAHEEEYLLWYLGNVEWKCPKAPTNSRSINKMFSKKRTTYVADNFTTKLLQ